MVCDRYALSSEAYQGQELDAAFVRSINDRAPPPDLTLFLRVTPAVALQRRQVRLLGAELFEATETQARVAAAYESAIARLGAAHRVVVIDGERSIEDVGRECLAHALRLLA